MSNFIEYVREFGDRCDFSITLARVQDNLPLIYVNEHFSHLTKYSSSESLEKNCRFLQGPDTGEKQIQGFSSGFKSEKAFFQDILNYTKSNTPFINRVIILPVFHQEDGKYFIGIQNKISCSDIDTYNFLNLTDIALQSDDLEHYINNPLAIIQGMPSDKIGPAIERIIKFIAEIETFSPIQK